MDNSQKIISYLDQLKFYFIQQKTKRGPKYQIYNKIRYILDCWRKPDSSERRAPTDQPTNQKGIGKNDHTKNNHN